jgi:hypothetical protein
MRDPRLLSRTRRLYLAALSVVVFAVAFNAWLILRKPTHRTLYSAMLPENQSGSNFVKLKPSELGAGSPALQQMFAGDRDVQVDLRCFRRIDNNELPLVENGKTVKGAQRVYDCTFFRQNQVVTILSLDDEDMILVMVQ